MSDEDEEVTELEALDDTDALCVHDVTMQYQEADDGARRIAARLTGHKAEAVAAVTLTFNLMAFNAFARVVREVSDDVSTK